MTRTAAIAASVAFSALSIVAAAQAPQPSASDPATRPGTSPPAPLQPLAPQPPPQISVPPPQPDTAWDGPRIRVNRIVLEGNSVLEAASVRALASRYEGRDVGAEELEALRLALTALYIDRGYVSSGVLLPDQDVRDGTVVMKAVEGALGEVAIDGDELWLRRSYLEPRLRTGAGRPLNVNTLRESIAVLQQDGLIERINAEVLPGLTRGEADLRVRIEEATPYQAGIGVSNHRNTAVGEVRTELFASHGNLTGWADRLEARVGATKGVDDFALSYSIPVTPRDTRLSLQASRSDALVIDPALLALDIRSQSESVALGLEHPVWRSSAATFKLGATVERRKNATFLLGFPFAFTPGIVDGSVIANILRTSATWIARKSDEALSARLQHSRGRSNVLSTKPSRAAPEQEFSAWLAQAQWAKRFDSTGAQLLARAELQYTRDVLLAMERYGLGGAGTIRGYRENQLLRDRGHLLSLEYRHPLQGRENPDGLQVAPFVDYGRSRSMDGTAANPLSIAGAGVGLLWNPNKHVSMQIYAARASREFPATTKKLQDHGVHFAASWSAF